MTNKMARNSVRIGWSKESFSSREEARQAGEDYLNSLEPIYQAGRSFRVTRTAFSDGKFEYEIYLGEKPPEFYQALREAKL